MHHFFLFPTMSCPAKCKYCFGEKAVHFTIPDDILISSLHLIKILIKENNSNKCSITFHGGEPLLAGFKFYKRALPLIKTILGEKISISIQTNLWRMNEDLANLFRKFDVGVGTSLDGPEEINDYNRGKGYFKKNQAGREILVEYGIRTGVISTFSNYTVQRAKEVFDYFKNQKMHFDIHSATPGMNHQNRDSNIFLSSEDYGNLLIELFDLYLNNLGKIRISTFDTLIRNISNDTSDLCVFSRCLGEYLAIAPDGELYPCNRFVGNLNFSFGNVSHVTSLEDIKMSKGWKKLDEWQKTIDETCKACLFKNICHGGCPYVGFARGNGKPQKDIYCEAYQKIYHHILDKGTEEYFNSHHSDCVIQETNSNKRKVSFKEKPILHIMHGYTHPTEVTRVSKEILSAAALGVYENPEKIADVFCSLNIVTSKKKAREAIGKLQRTLKNSHSHYNNAYFHITSGCNIDCSYCYAKTSGEVKHGYIPVDKIIESIQDASNLNFRKIVITGGEPSVHPHFSLFVDKILELKRTLPIPPMVLRTNLISSFEHRFYQKMYEAFDEIVVSIDGSEEFHDKRRGYGSYQRTISNLSLLGELKLNSKVSIAAVFDYANMLSEALISQENHLIDLKDKFNLKRMKFLPLLPLGKARNTNMQRPVEKNITVEQWIELKRYPKSSCGIGYVIMIDSDGSVYPCHVYKSKAAYLGNILETNFATIVSSENFKRYRSITVDSREKCSMCSLRYLCGGACNIWENCDCQDLFESAKNLLMDAARNLEISKSKLDYYGFVKDSNDTI